jgi:hypothetical protein
MPQDERQRLLDLTSEPEALSSAARNIESPASERDASLGLLTVGNNGFYHGLRQLVSDQGRFERRDDTPYPCARLETSEALGDVQLRPDPAPKQPLLPVADGVWERLKALSDLEADELDILTSTWLKQAKTVNDRAFIFADDLLALRAIKPKKNGKGRRDGYTPEQRRSHLEACSVIFDLWLSLEEVVVSIGKGKRQKRLSLQSRAFVITDRFGDLRLYDEYMDVRAFTYLPGEAFAALLLGSRRAALLSSPCAQI